MHGKTHSTDEDRNVFKNVPGGPGAVACPRVVDVTGRAESNTAGEADAAMTGIHSVFRTGTNAREDALDGRSQECVQERAGRFRSRDLLESSRE